jgi:hypothetical protein
VNIRYPPWHNSVSKRDESPQFENVAPFVPDTKKDEKTQSPPKDAKDILNHPYGSKMILP